MKPIAMMWSLALLCLASYGTYAQTLCDTAIAGIEVNLSLSSNCRLDIQPYMVTSNYNPDYQYSLVVMTESDDTLDMPVTGMSIGDKLKVMITSDSCNSLGVAWSYVNIEDKFKPVLTCPDTLIECVDFVFYNPEIDIHDCQEVDVDILSETTEQLCDPSLTAKVVRHYRVTDQSGNTDTCTQEFTIKRFDLNNDVEFPPGEIYVDCAILDQFLDGSGNIIPPPIDLPVGSGAILETYPFGVPTASGSPLHGLNFKACGVRAYFESMPSLYDGCKNTYWREWTVYEWHCTEELSRSMIQKIVVIDTTAPQFSFAEDTLYFFTGGHGCTADIPFSSLGMSQPVDLCTPFEDLEIDIVVCDYGNLASLEDTIFNVGLDTLLVKVSVSDKCHQNTAKDSITIIVLDRTPPQAICEQSVKVALPDSNGVKLPAALFNAGSYDFCTDIILDARRMDESEFADSVMFSCADKDSDVMVVLRMTDAFGNAHSCMVTANVTDSMNHCPLPRQSLAGRVLYEDGIPVTGEMVRIFGGVNLETTTDGNGYFHFADVQSDLPVIVMPVKDDDHSYGISTYDIILMQKHILGLEQLDSPYKVIAADVNGNGRINASDLFELRSLILADTERFPSSTSYVFIPSEMHFDDPAEPWDQGDIFGYKLEPQNIPQQIDLMGIKVGDVNKSSLGASGRNTSEHVQWHALSKLTDSHEFIEIYAPSRQQLEGFQTTVEWNPGQWSFNEIVSGQIHVEKSHYSDRWIGEGKLAISWNDILSLDIDPGNPIFSLKFDRRDGLNRSELAFSDDIIKTEVYLADMAPMPLALQESLPSPEGVQLYTNIPNPWSTQTKLVFNLPYETEVVITIYDASMKVVWSHRGKYAQGDQTIRITDRQVPGPGLYFYELQWHGGASFSKMIRIR